MITPHSTLCIKVEGPRQANTETVILLHGGPGTPDYLAPVAELLSKHYQTVSFDQRGTGQSIVLNNSYLLDEYLDDIRAVARFVGVTTFHLFGHSWGGLLAQLYAKRFPNDLKSLFLCSPVPGTGRQWISMILEESLFIIKKASLRDLLTIAGSWLRGEWANSDADWQRFYATVWRYYFSPPTVATPLSEEWLLGIHAAPIRGTVRSVIRTAASVLSRETLEIGVLTGILYGERDFIQRSRKPVLRRFPQAHLYEIKEAGHVSWTDNPMEFRAALADFYGRANITNA